MIIAIIIMMIMIIAIVIMMIMIIAIVIMIMMMISQDENIVIFSSVSGVSRNNMIMMII